MDIHQRPLQSYYASRAPEYDAVYLKPERQADLRAIEGWLPAVVAGSNVLEIACGTGYWTQFIAQTAMHVTALDTSPETIRIAEHRILPGKVTFLIGDAYQLPFGAGIFNAAFAGFWLSHVPKARRLAFLQGLNGCLLPGAKVVLIDNVFVAGSSSPVAETDSAGDTYQMRQLKDGSTHRILKNFVTEGELRSLLHGIGHDGTFSAWRHFWAFEYVATGRQSVAQIE